MGLSSHDGTVVVSMNRDDWVPLLPGIIALSGVSGIPFTPSSEAELGIDMIDMQPGSSFPLHTHPGAHILYMLEGEGTVTVNDRVYATHPGECYFVLANQVHAVGAIQHHRLLAIGFPHKSINDPHRMELADDDFADAQPDLARIYSGADTEERTRLLQELQSRSQLPVQEGNSE